MTLTGSMPWHVRALDSSRRNRSRSTTRQAEEETVASKWLMRYAAGRGYNLQRFWRNVHDKTGPV